MRRRTVAPPSAARSASFRTSTSEGHARFRGARRAIDPGDGSRHGVHVDRDHVERARPRHLHRDARELRARRAHDEEAPEIDPRRHDAGRIERRLRIDPRAPRPPVLACAARMAASAIDAPPPSA